MGKNNDLLFGFVLCLMLLSIIGFAAYAMLTGKSLKEADGIILFLTSNCAFLLGYRWGSSKGSKEKDDIINNLKK
jgi:hypothetical protein